jgi:hypothetical protein
MTVVSVLLTLTATAGWAQITNSDGIPPMQNRKLFMHYDLAKSEFLIGEPIFLRMQLENASSEVQYFGTAEVQEYKVIDGSGREMTPSMGWGRFNYVQRHFVPGVGDGVHVAIAPASRTDIRIENILDHYGEGSGAQNFYLEPGSYRVANSSVQSDTVCFSVVDPSKESDVQALQLVKLAANTRHLQRGSDSTVQFYEDFLEKYPNSVYSPMMLARLVIFAFLGDDALAAERQLHYSLRLIRDFPSSEYAGDALRFLDVDALPASEKTKLRTALEEIAGHFKGTLIEVDASRLLRELEQ